MEVIDLELGAQHDTLATKQDLRMLGREMEVAKHDLELKIERIRGDLMRWVFTCILGQTAILMGAAYFLTGHPAK